LLVFLLAADVLATHRVRWHAPLAAGAG